MAIASAAPEFLIIGLEAARQIRVQYEAHIGSNAWKNGAARLAELETNYQKSDAAYAPTINAGTEAKLFDGSLIALSPEPGSHAFTSTKP